MKKNEKKKIENARMFNVADTLSPMCDECRQYAAKFYLWNSEMLEGIEEVAVLALETIPGRVGTEEYFESLRRVLAKLQPTMLKDITKVGIDLAVFQCPKNECKQSCRKYEHWK